MAMFMIMFENRFKISLRLLIMINTMTMITILGLKFEVNMKFELAMIRNMKFELTMIRIKIKFDIKFKSRTILKGHVKD